MPKGTERRRYRRIQAKLGLKVTLLDGLPNVVVPSETAHTENVSPGDLYYLSVLAGRLKQGSKVNLEIDLPVGAANSFSGKHLDVEGEVVRLVAEIPGTDDSRCGVAVRFLHTPRFGTALE